jgi:RNA polymerase sigma-70 factor (ECF subfamily)
MDHFRAGRRRYPEGRPAEAPALDASAEERALESIGGRTLLAMIEDLSLDQQQVLVLKFLFDFSNVQAAAILGKSEGAVKSLQHRALASLEREMSAR